ncbi:hypothetical protein D3C78_1502650 [compost metagenome]
MDFLSLDLVGFANRRGTKGGQIVAELKGMSVKGEPFRARRLLKRLGGGRRNVERLSSRRLPFQPKDWPGAFSSDASSLIETLAVMTPSAASIRRCPAHYSTFHARKSA